MSVKSYCLGEKKKNAEMTVTGSKLSGRAGAAKPSLLLLGKCKSCGRGMSKIVGVDSIDSLPPEVLKIASKTIAQIHAKRGRGESPDYDDDSFTGGDDDSEQQYTGGRKSKSRSRSRSSSGKHKSHSSKRKSRGSKKHRGGFMSKSKSKSGVKHHKRSHKTKY
jgi:hypothetical protein